MERRRNALKLIKDLGDAARVEQSFDFICKLSDRIPVIQKGVLVRDVPAAGIAELERDFLSDAVGAAR